MTNKTGAEVSFGEASYDNGVWTCVIFLGEEPVAAGRSRAGVMRGRWLAKRDARERAELYRGRR